MQVTAEHAGLRISALTEAAERAGLRLHMPLADARAICPVVAVETADVEADAAALHKLALWCRRYSPWTTMHAPDGVTIEITGCAHLFGGEAELLTELEQRLRVFGLTARFAIAPTIGGAWALARYGDKTRCIITGHSLRELLVPLPVASLRLDPSMLGDLAMVGLKRIGDLIGKPRAPLTARFGPRLLQQFERALGHEDEALEPLAPPPLYRAERRFAEPIATTTAVEHVVARLAQDLAVQLTEAGRGARCIELELFRVDGHVEMLAVRTSALSREAAHLARLFRERIEQIGGEFDAGFGFDAATLSAFDVEVFVCGQDDLQANANHAADPANLARLIDRFVNRFGATSIVRFAPRASYMPEHAMQPVPVAQEKESGGWAAHLRTLQGGPQLGRPLLLLSIPEEVTALSEVPDGPPIRFVWKRVAHQVARADGPERIAPEWWLHPEGERRRTRDYYRVEDEEGRRFWLFRSGLYERGEEKRPRWFIHGMFA